MSKAKECARNSNILSRPVVDGVKSYEERRFLITGKDED
jgi:hypothetical protein